MPFLAGAEIAPRQAQDAPLRRELLRHLLRPGLRERMAQIGEIGSDRLDLPFRQRRESVLKNLCTPVDLGPIVLAPIAQGIDGPWQRSLSGSRSADLDAVEDLGYLL